MSGNFSVLLSVYYKEKPQYLKQALDSVFQQTLRSDDVILVEDGRLEDHNPELEFLVREYEAMYPELHVVRFSQNRGLGYALNDGLAYCKHDIVARMDTDDIAKPERFEQQMQVLTEHPEYGLISSWVEEFEDIPGDSQSVRKVPETPRENLEYARSRCPVNHPTVMYRKSEVLQVGGYQTKLFPEDYFLWIKMLQNGTRIYNIQKSLLWFRYSSETIKRRGGWKYAYDELKTQHNIYKMGFIDVFTFMKNILIRFIVRILPMRIRVEVYKLIRRIK